MGVGGKGDKCGGGNVWTGHTYIYTVINKGKKGSLIKLLYNDRQIG